MKLIVLEMLFKGSISSLVRMVSCFLDLRGLGGYSKFRRFKDQFGLPWMHIYVFASAIVKIIHPMHPTILIFYVYANSHVISFSF